MSADGVSGRAHVVASGASSHRPWRCGLDLKKGNSGWFAWGGRYLEQSQSLGARIQGGGTHAVIIRLITDTFPPRQARWQLYNSASPLMQADGRGRDYSLVLSSESSEISWSKKFGNEFQRIWAKRESQLIRISGARASAAS
jgi:hypothetical protein